MKKRFLLTLLAMVCTLCCAFSLSACNFGRQSTQQYTVTYDANGGRFSDGTARVTQTVDEGAKLTEPAAPTNGTTAFGGWAKTENGGTLWNFSSDTVSGNTTLYAVWGSTTLGVSLEGGMVDEEAKTVYLLVDKNTDSVALVDKVSCPTGSIWRLYYDKMGSNEIPTKTAVGKSGALENGDNEFYIIVTTADASKVDTYKLTVHRSYSVEVKYYDAQGELIYTDRADTGRSYKVDHNPSIPGYTFNFWKNEKGDEVTSVTVSGALAFYADCTNKTYTATLDVSGGNDLDNAEFSVTYDEPFTFPVPTRTGYGFGGWYDGKTQVTDATGAAVKDWSYASNKTLTAKWNANTYAVTLRKDVEEGGTVLGAGDKAYGSRVTVTATTNKGYTWLGWYDEDGEQVTDAFGYTFDMEFAVTLTAKWMVCPVSIRTTSYVYGPMGTVTGFPDTTVAGAETTVTAVTKTSDSYNYCWLGWYDGNDERLTGDYSYTFTVPTSAEAVTYTAKWALAPAIYAQSDTAGNILGKPDEYYAGQELHLTAQTARLGYLFQGWYDATEAQNEVKLTDDFTLDYTIPVSDRYTRIVAKWKYDDRLDMFEFSSSSTACTITKVKSNYTNVTELVVPEYVTSIKYGALSGLSKLEKLTVPFVGASASESSTATNTRFLGYIFGGTAYTGGTVVTQYYLGDNYRFCAPETLREVTVTGGKILEGAFRGFNDLTAVTIGDNVTEIGPYAFYQCAGLTTLTLGKGLTKIGDCAFDGCRELTGEITIPEGIKTIGSYLFHWCSKITRVTLPEGVTVIGARAFDSCRGLEEINIPEGVTSIGERAFLYCEGLTGKLVIPETVTTIGESAFGWCENLTELQLSNKIKKIGKNAFSVLTSLEKIDYRGSLTDWLNSEHLQYLTESSAALYLNGVQLTELSLPAGFDAVPAYAFRGRLGLTGADLTEVARIGTYAFYGCSDLQTLTISKDVTDIGASAFDRCSAFETIDFKGDLTDWFVMTGKKTLMLNGAALSFHGKRLEGLLEVPAGTESVPDYAFYGCSGLTSVSLPESLTSIGEGAFAHNGLTGITFPAGLTSIGDSAFGDCTSLANISFPQNLTSIGSNAFKGCVGFTAVVVPDHVTSIGEGAFNGCANIESITIPYVGAVSDSSSAKYVYPLGYIFGTDPYTGATETTQLVYERSTKATSRTLYAIPEKLKNITVTGQKITYGAFYNCGGLTQFCFLALTSIESYAFYGCIGLTEIEIPANTTSIDSYTFYGCTGLTEIKFPSQLSWIGSYSFYGCTGLTSIVIPPSVRTINSYAFYMCTNLTSASFAHSSWKGVGTSGTATREIPISVPDAATGALYLTKIAADGGNSAYKWQYVS